MRSDPRSGVLSLACALLAGCAAEPLRAGEFLPLDFLPAGGARRWDYAVGVGERTTRLHCLREGGDVRTLEGVAVPYAFVFGTPEGYDAPTAKSIWARPATGARLFYLDAWLWSLECVPPLELVPGGAPDGARWSFSGSVELERVELGPAELTLQRGEVRTKAGERLAALRVEQLHARTGARIEWCFAAGVGLVSVEVSVPDRPLRWLAWTELADARAP